MRCLRNFRITCIWKSRTYRLSDVFLRGRRKTHLFRVPELTLWDNRQRVSAFFYFLIDPLSNALAPRLRLRLKIEVIDLSRNTTACSDRELITVAVSGAQTIVCCTSIHVSTLWAHVAAHSRGQTHIRVNHFQNTISLMRETILCNTSPVTLSWLSAGAIWVVLKRVHDHPARRAQLTFQPRPVLFHIFIRWSVWIHCVLLPVIQSLNFYVWRCLNAV